MRLPLLFLSSCTLLFAASCSKPPEAAQQPKVQAPKPAPVAAPASDAQAKANRDAVLMGKLMTVVFDPKSVNSENDLIAELPDPENRSERGKYEVHPKGMTVLPTGETIMVVNAWELDDNGIPITAHATSGLLNIFVLKEIDGQWQVPGRFENIDQLGSSGELGDIHWVSLGAGKTGLAMLHGGTWQGMTIVDLSLYDVTSGKVRALSKKIIPLHSDNEGSCMAGADCWSVDGTWRFAARPAGAEYDDLLIDFDSETWKENAAGDAPHQQSKKTARYRFDGEQFKLMEGTNIVPPI